MPKILVIDDDPDAALLARLTLEMEGHVVAIAGEGVDGLAQAATEPPDLVILDVMMPDMDGLEVCQRLRGQRATANLPVIMLSGKGQVVDKVRGLRAGADEYVTKPIDPAELLARVESLLIRSEARRRQAPQGKLMAVLGAKGGVGATTVAINLGAALLQHGDRAVLIEFQPYFGSVASMLGLSPPSSLAQFGRTSVEDITASDVERQMLYHGSGLRVLTAALSTAQGDCDPLDRAHAKAVLDRVVTLADWTMVDLPVQPTPASEAALERCNLVALITEADSLSLRCARNRLAWLEKNGIYGQLVGVVVVNRSPACMRMSIEDIEGMLGATVAAVVPPAAEVCVQALHEQRPLLAVAPDHYAASVFREMAARLRQAEREPEVARYVAS